MFRKWMQWLLQKPVTLLAEKLSSAPDKEAVFKSLEALLARIRKGNRREGLLVPFDYSADRFIIFSDQHKGCRDPADDFRFSEKNYLAALDYYYENDFCFINLGDAEELWKNSPARILRYNSSLLESEARFLREKRYYRVFGNHDLEWKFPFQQKRFLRPLFGKKLKVYQGLELQTQYNQKTWSVFLTHGHQGDKRSDGNKLSMWVVAAIWTPIQRFLGVSINTTANSFELVDAHNIIMYEWSATQQQLIFISGHTHKPVFASLDHIDRLNAQLEAAKKAGDTAAENAIQVALAARQKEYEGKKTVRCMAYPSYFNSGCCCFNDGDITGIEIAGGFIRLIRWKPGDNGVVMRNLLEEAPLTHIFDRLKQR